MWRSSNKRYSAPFLLLLLLLVFPSFAEAATEVSGAIEAEVRWEGQILLTGPVSVPPGAVLEIAAGTVVTAKHAGAKIVVQGRLRAVGTAQSPIDFAAVEGWQGIDFIESQEKSRLEHVRFRRFETALSFIAASPQIRQARFEQGGTAIKLLRESRPLIEKSSFDGNRIGVEIGMKSAPSIRDNTFRGHETSAVVASNNSAGQIEGNLFEKNTQAIGIVQPYRDRISKNRFVGNGTGIYCNQTQNTPVIADNVFEDNDKALVNFAFSYPKVENNRFVGNREAVHNDQFGSPQLVHNLFRRNGKAVYSYRKSNPKIEKNVFEANGLILYCDYSSYPQVRGNNFLDNDQAVELGIYQSADWEKRSGSKKIVMEQARARGTKNPLLPQAPTEFKDVVDVSGNWWGKQTARLAQAGADGNLDLFYDRRDKPTVTYEGFGPESYALDWVKFAPWLEAPVPNAGVRKAP